MNILVSLHIVTCLADKYSLTWKKAIITAERLKYMYIGREEIKYKHNFSKSNKK